MTSLKTLLLFGVALAVACAKSGSTPMDLGRDSSTGDLARRDLSSPVDGGSCTQVATWPGLNPQAAFDTAAGRTLMLSQRQSSSPLDVLSVEDYHTVMGETYPKNLSFSVSDTYTACDVCVRLLEGCTSGSCTRRYFAQGGMFTVTKADTNAAAGRMTVSGSNVRLVEWTFPVATDGGTTGDLPVAGGRCWQIGSISLDVPWNTNTDGGSPADLAGVDAAVGDLGPGGCAPVVNEVMTGTSASATEEFVEVYNPCPSAIDLTGWKLAYRSAANVTPVGATDVTLFAWTGVSIPAGGYLVYGGANFTNAKQDGKLLAGIAGSGAVGIRDPSNNLVDSVGFGTVNAANAFIEGTAAPLPPVVASPGNSISRLPNGTDTNNNSADFSVSTKITPKAANQ